MKSSSVSHCEGSQNEGDALPQMSRDENSIQVLRESLRAKNPAMLAIRPAGRDQPLPLSYAQHRLWFLDQLTPDSAIYNSQEELRLIGELVPEALRKSLNEIVRRHELLRTRFETVAGEPVQLITEANSLAIEVEDLRGLEKAQQESMTEAIAREEALMRFDLSRGPLIRVRLLRLADQEHIFMITLHHIVIDAWSIGVMMKEFAALYASYSAGQESPLIDLEVQYADYAVWQRRWLDGEILEEHLNYWRRQLNGMKALELPTDRARPAAASHRGAVEEFEIGEELANRLRMLSRREHVTMFMTLLAVFQMVLGRYAGQDDVAVGTVIANRNRPEINELIGFFVNTLVLRTDLSGNPSFRELLKRVREVTVKSYQHQDVPFEKLVEELSPERNLSRSPLIQVMLVLQNIPQERIELPGLQIRRILREHNASQYDLAMVLADSPSGGLRGWLTYATDLFDSARIKRMTGHFEMLLQEAAAIAERPIWELEMLTDLERRQLLVEWNDTQVEYERRCMHEFFEERAELHSDAIAVVYKSENLSYGELDRRANQVGNYLKSMGIGPEVRVGVRLERGPEMITAIFGVLKSGGAYVPIDPNYPMERLNYIINQAQMAVIITQEALEDLLPMSLAGVVCLDRDWERIEAERVDKPISGVRTDNLAYVIYTSGSTGKPKGVEISHLGVSNLLKAQKAFLGEGMAVLQFASASFDAAVWELLAALLTGGKLVMADRLSLMPGEGLLQVLGEHEIEEVLLPPSAMAAMTGRELTALKKLISGGEACSRELMNRWGAGRDFVNAYGPTEMTVIATMWRGGSEAAEVLIGSPIVNTEVYVLDDGGRPAGVGIPGDLYTAGAGIARGYLKEAWLTGERFAPNPYGRQRGARMYRTGDIARWREDGNLEFLGRADHQVKVRGHRIELGEIEAVLHGHKSIEQCAVVVREDEAGAKKLAAYIVERDGEAASIEEIRKYLQGKVPDYMLPNSVMKLERMPMTANGKIDRRSLPSAGGGSEVRETEIARSGVEEIVRGIYGKALGAERIAMEESFFSMGGHSLLATQVANQIGNRFGVEIPLREMFERPTVRGISEYVEAERKKGKMAAPRIEREVRAERTPLSAAQRRLWFIDRLEPNSSAYNMPFIVRMKGPVEVEALEKSLSEIVRRHEVLRTRIEEVGTEIAQVIGEADVIGVEVEDLRDAPEPLREKEAEKRAREEGRKRFDLSQGPMMRVRMLRMAEDEYEMLLTMHHIVGDGWSIGVMIKELGILYEAYRAGKRSPLEEPEIQYADYAIWQKRWMQGKAVEEQMSYWKNQLKGAPELQLPEGTDEERKKRGAGGSLRRNLGEPTAKAIRKFNEREEITLFMTLLAAFAVALHRQTKQRDLMIGTDIANRNRAGTEGMIGFFVNELFMRIKLAEGMTLGDLLSAVRETALAGYDNQDLPFDKVVEMMRSERRKDQTPLIRAKLVVQNAPIPPLEMGKLSIEMRGGHNEGLKCDLLATFFEAGNELVGEWTYNRSLLRKPAITVMAEEMEEVILMMMENLELRIAEVLARLEQSLGLKQRQRIASALKLKGDRGSY